MSTTFSPESILKDLSKLWTQLADDKSAENTSGVIRACTMTFITAMDGEEDSQDINEIVPELMHGNPSRVLLLRVLRNGTTSGNIAARVQAQCWLPFGQRQQICCEQIEIESPISLLSDVPKLILSLAAADLPVVLYVRSPRLVADRGFQDFFSLAHKVVIDSEKFADPAAGSAFVRSAYQLGWNVADLAWTRLTGLRQLISQLCGSDGRRTRVPEIKAVRVLYAPPVSLIAAQYLGSWFRAVLPEAEVVVASGNQTTVMLAGPELSISLNGGDTAVIQKTNDYTSSASLPRLNEKELLREELSLIGPDPIFRRCLKIQ